MQQLVYVSETRAPMQPTELSVLLEQSRRKNRALGITGVLLHQDRGLVQVLEGQAEAVGRLYATIRVDGRHQGLVELLNQASDRRLFPGWPLASGPNAVELSADWDPMRGHLPGQSSDIVNRTPGPVSALLLAFLPGPRAGGTFLR